MTEQEKNLKSENQQEKKREQSLRILEALNDIDDDLLLRSEKEPKVIKFPARAGRVVAAVLGLFVAGAVFYSATGSSMRKMSFTSINSGGNFMLANDAATPQMEQSPREETESVTADSTAGDSLKQVNGAGANIVGETTDQNKTESCTNQAYVLSMGLEEAREIEQLGEYIPVELPEGFEFGQAILSMDEFDSSLMVSWRNGMKECAIIIHKATTENIYVMDINDTDRYDVRKYAIPYADTVPEAYLMEFLNPVFSAGDMTREVMDSRVQPLQEEGEEAPVANFGILLEDGILIDFHTKMTADELWTVVSALL